MGQLEGLVRLGTKLRSEPEAVVGLAAEWLKVRAKDGRMVPLAANAAQREFERRRGGRDIVLKARQMGMTTWVAGRFFLRTVTRPGTTTLLVAHTREAAEAMLSIVETMWQGLDDDLREGPLTRSRANAGRMVFGEIGSEIRVGSAADENAGRGLSVQNLHCSEVARWPGDAAATLAGLRAALAPGGEMVLESTPYGAYGAFYEEWRRGEGSGIREQGTGLVRHFFPWWMERGYVGPAVAREAMSAEEIALVEREGLSAEQIGFRRELERTYGVLRSQEFAEDAESCFRATGACCFDVAAIERRMAELGEPVEVRRGGALLVWWRAVPGREYVVAVDSAGGGDEGDFAAVEVIDRVTGVQCAELRQRLRPAELARAAAEMAREYAGAEIVVERNNHGAAVLAYLETVERYGRVWRARGSAGSGAAEAGWLTTAANKAGMVARLGRVMELEPERLQSRRLLAEMRTFVSGERGKAGAAAGEHDDLVMAMAVGLAAMEVGR